MTILYLGRISKGKVHAFVKLMVEVRKKPEFDIKGLNKPPFFRSMLRDPFIFHIQNKTV